MNKSKKQKISKKKKTNTNNKKEDTNNKKYILFIKIIGFIFGIFMIIVNTHFEDLTHIIPKYFSFFPPSLDVSRNISTTSPFYYAKIPEDINGYLVVQTSETGNISIKLTNNDESTLTINNIYLDVVDYQFITDVKISDGIWGDGYSSPIYYGVQLENLCKKYKCIMLDQESAEKFSTNYELPDETNFKVMVEQIECNNTDEIEIIFSPMYSGIYRFKIVIDYSIRSFNDIIESDEFDFVSLDSSFKSQD